MREEVNKKMYFSEPENTSPGYFMLVSSDFFLFFFLDIFHCIFAQGLNKNQIREMLMMIGNSAFSSS